MSWFDSEVFKVLRSVDIPEDKAVKAAVALYEMDGARRRRRMNLCFPQKPVASEDGHTVMARRAELTSAGVALKSDVAQSTKDFPSFRDDIAETKTIAIVLRWMVATAIGLQLVVLLSIGFAR